MLNNFSSFNIGDTTTKVSFNAPCTGIIQKSHPKSNFEVFHKASKMADWVFSDYPRLKKEKYNCDIILQIMVFGDNELLMEYVYEKRFK